MAYKPTVKVDGKFCTNSLVFATKEEALASSRELMGRWMMVSDFSYEESDEPVNYEFDLKRNIQTPLPTAVSA